VNDVEPKVAQRPSHQFTDSEASRSKGVVAEFVQRWKVLVETVNASISTGNCFFIKTLKPVSSCTVTCGCRMQLQREDIGRCAEAVIDAASSVSICAMCVAVAA
jgi:hypothetical protein